MFCTCLDVVCIYYTRISHSPDTRISMSKTYVFKSGGGFGGGGGDDDDDNYENFFELSIFNGKQTHYKHLNVLFEK